jgi:DNA-binding transcriptional LysR family regulator
VLNPHIRILKRPWTSVRHNGEDMLRMASYTSISRNWLPKAMRIFPKSTPGKAGHAGRLRRRDRKMGFRRHVDIGLASSNFSGGLEFIHLFDDPYYAVLPPAPRRWATPTTYAAFEGQNFLVPSYGMDLDILRTLQRHGVTPLFSLLAMEDQAVIKMVEQGLGVSMLSELVLKAAPATCLWRPWTLRPAGSWA